MSKTRREQFESQLRSLQDDISSLSRRLGNPVSAMSAQSDPKIETSRAFPLDAKNPTKGKGDKSRLAKEKRSLERERDDLLFRVEQLNRENAELRESMMEIQRVKSLYEHLKQDHDSLLLSLQSSERIRRQQKELIQILQKSAATNGISTDSTFSLSVHAQEDCMTSQREHSPRYEMFGTSNAIENISTTSDVAARKTVPEYSNSKTAPANSLEYQRSQKKELNSERISREKMKSKATHNTTLKAGSIAKMKNCSKGPGEANCRPTQRRSGNTAPLRTAPNSQRKRDTVPIHRKTVSKRREL